MKKILVTGGAGFIGSNLIESLLDRKYQVVCLDNLSTGFTHNIEEFFDNNNFEFVEGDILDFKLLKNLTKDVFAVSHQAALGSVPRSIKDPLTTNRVNIEGTLNVLKACVDNKVQRVIYAASSSTYGDSPKLPKKEHEIGNPLSPYAVTKLVNELYADVFQKVYGLNTIGLRYFNVFGPKQDPNGAYAAVIPLFMKAILSGNRPTVNGDGNHSRDFTFVANAVQANIKSIEAPINCYNTVYNIACGERTTLNELVGFINDINGSQLDPVHGSERDGDIEHSLADISKATHALGYSPEQSVKEGLHSTIEWYNRIEKSTK
ncbi:MAG: SDR family oxidoreductase [Ekhidna sp.]